MRSTLDRWVRRSVLATVTSLWLAYNTQSCRRCASHAEREARANPPAASAPPLASGAPSRRAGSSNQGPGAVRSAPAPVAIAAGSATRSAPVSSSLLSFAAPLPADRLLSSLPAMRYARLQPAECEAALRAAKIPHRREQGAGSKRKREGDIRTPIRLSGPLNGVSFEAPAPPIVFGKLDCRLAIALHAMASILARYRVVGVRVDNMYRPGAIVQGKNKPSQHAAGLAIDIMGFELANGEQLVVERDWRGALGKPYCGPKAVLTERHEQAPTTLRDMICSVVRAGLFHHTVTPSDNRAHRDHLHFDLDPSAKRVRVER